MSSSKLSIVLGRSMVLAMIGLMPLTAGADGSPAGENRSTILRRKIELPDVRVRKGALRTKKSHIEGSVGKYAELGNDANEGTRIEGKGQLEGVLVGLADQSGSIGMSIGGEGKIAYEMGKDSANELRDAEITGFTLFGGQAVVLKDADYGDESDLEAKVRRFEAAALEAQSELSNNYHDGSRYSVVSYGYEKNMNDEFTERLSVIAKVDETKLNDQKAKAQNAIHALNQKVDDDYFNAALAHVGSQKVVEESRKAIGALVPKHNQLMSQYLRKREELKRAKEGSTKAELIREEISSILAKVRGVEAEMQSSGANTSCTKELAPSVVFSVPCKSGGKYEIDYDLNFAQRKLGPKSQWIEKSYPGKKGYQTEMAKLNQELKAIHPKLEALEAEKAELAKKHKEKNVATFDADKKKLEATIAENQKELDALRSKIHAIRKKAENKPGREWASIDMRVGTVGYQSRSRKELGLKKKGIVVDPVSLAFHLTGELNETVDVGLCGALSPLRILVGGGAKHTEIAGVRDEASKNLLDARASLCAEVGLGQHLMLRNTTEIATDYSKSYEIRNTTELEGLKGHASVGATYERATDVGNDKSVQRVLGTATLAW